MSRWDGSDTVLAIMAWTPIAGVLLLVSGVDFGWGSPSLHTGSPLPAWCWALGACSFAGLAFVLLRRARQRGTPTCRPLGRP
jgi:hypothetical protein